MKTKCDDTFCPLCGSDHVDSFFEDKKRAYLSCLHCKLVFVTKKYWLSLEDEQATYDLHENDPQDQGYRRFLSRLSTPLLKKLGTNQKGLDFGCGPGPTLSLMLQEQGHHVDLYDPLFCNDTSVFGKHYDFICATEVVEHMHNPNQDFSFLFQMLKPGGWLGIMTKLVIDKNAFSKWHYIHDMTHVCFYSRPTFEYIAQRFNADLSFIGKDVILLNKKPHLECSHKIF